MVRCYVENSTFRVEICSGMLWFRVGKTRGKTHLPRKAYKYSILGGKSLNVTIRREMGSDIDGACGQLRRRYVETR